MDVLPHIESIAFQKVQMFGTIKTTVVPISQLAYEPNPEPGGTNIPYSDNIYWKSNKSSIDSKLAFRNTVDG